MTNQLGPGSPPTEMLRRLRARPASSWAIGDREGIARRVMQQLADAAADAAGSVGSAGSAGPHRLVPDAGVMAIADQITVLYADAVDAGVPGDVLDRASATLREGLGLHGGRGGLGG